eukprot:739197-Amphidinium_carterae.1
MKERDGVTIRITIRSPWSQAEPCRPPQPSRSPSSDPCQLICSASGAAAALAAMTASAQGSCGAAASGSSSASRASSCGSTTLVPPSPAT